MKKLFGVCFLINSLFLFGQFESKIETDSSKIRIIRNSVYKVYEETFKNKDSIWYSVHYIDDTTQLNTEGWMLKTHERLGIWKEYTREGELMYTHDHDKEICTVNKKLYPYHDLLKKMKQKADNLIKKTYSESFFKNHVKFSYDCYAYDNEGYVGSWTEPMKRKPNKFLFRYSVRLTTTSKWQKEMIGMELDSVGNYIPSTDFSNNYGFEALKDNNKTFKLRPNKAIEIAKTQGLKKSDSSKIDAFLFWDKFKKAIFFDGQFRYYITELAEEIKDLKENGRSKITYKYNVYVFNPWSGDFIEKKRMKSIRSWTKLSGHSTGLLPDN